MRGLSMAGKSKYECPKDEKGYRDCFRCPYADCLCNDKMDEREAAIYAEYHPNDIQINHNRAEMRAIDELCGRYFKSAKRKDKKSVKKA